MKGIFQTTILIPNLQEIINFDIPETSKIKVQLDTEKHKSIETFSSEEISDLKLKLDDLMNSKKLYRNAELNLNELASEMEGKTNDLVERILSDPRFNIDKEKLQEVLDPMNFIGFAPIQTEEFLAEHVKPILDANQDLIGLETDLKV